MQSVWTFLNSGLFQAIAISVIGLVWKKTDMSKQRKEKIEHYGDDLFNVVETIGKQKGMEGTAKWTLFLKEMMDHLKEEKDKPLTDSEVGQLRNLAFRKSWLKKGTDKAIPVTMKKE